MAEQQTAIVPVEVISNRIHVIRGMKVILDHDLARLYGVTTKRLNEQVRRNKDRFPEDFLIRLTAEEKTELVAKCDHLANLKYAPTLPFAYTEHGALMAATVLKTTRAVEVSIYVVRAFVHLRRRLAEQEAIMRKIEELENRLAEHDEHFRLVFAALKELVATEDKPKRRIGF